MKIEIDKKLLKYGIYVTVTAVAIYVAYLIISNALNIIGVAGNIVLYTLNLFKPLIIAVIISYLLYPIVKVIEKWLKKAKFIKKKTAQRTIAIICAYISIMAFFLILMFGIYYMIGGQISKSTTLTNMVNDLYVYFTSNLMDISSINKTLKNLDSPYIQQLKPYIIKGIEYVQKYIATNLSNFTSHMLTLGSSIVTFFISIILSIYILNDIDYFLGLWNKIYKLIFRESALGKNINYIFKTIHVTFAKYIKGQFLEGMCVGVLSCIALYIVGIDYAFVIGIISGICNMIPYVGPLIGVVLAVIMALLEGSVIKVVYAIIAMLIVQQIDNNLLAPKIVGESVGLHAVFTMMAILIGGSLGGLFGMLLAVPIAASFRVLFNNWYEKYAENHED